MTNIDFLNYINGKVVKHKDTNIYYVYIGAIYGYDDSHGYNNGLLFEINNDLITDTYSIENILVEQTLDNEYIHKASSEEIENGLFNTYITVRTIDFNIYKLRNDMNSYQYTEYELNNLTISLSSLNGTYEKNNAAHIERLKNINAQYQLQINDTQTALDEVKKELAALHAALNTSDLFELKTKLNAVQMEKNNHLKNLEDAKKELSEIIAEEQKLTAEIQEYTTKQNDIDAHIKVVTQLNTLVKRDFRGYLLKDIIDYIDLRAKEYSEVVFGTRDLSFELDGNNINISYCNKAFENLSGGEKQRLDLIIQFAIRDMMSRYLGFSSNILILDEIFDNLDAKSTSSILNLITTKLSDVESIFIISHHSEELDLPVDSQITIVKDENGISDIR